MGYVVSSKIEYQTKNTINQPPLYCLIYFKSFCFHFLASGALLDPAANSNTCLTNIFQKFSRGCTTKGDPVAVLISWGTKHDGELLDPTGTSSTTGNASSPPASTVAGPDQGGRKSRSGCLTEEAAGGTEHYAASAVSSGDIMRRHAVDDIGSPHTVAVIGHLTAGHLHEFLFGEGGVRADNASTVAGEQPDLASVRGTTRSRGQHQPDLAAPSPTIPTPHTHGNSILGGAGDGTSFMPSYPRRSEAAANAALAGGGYCLLQTFVQPSGGSNSTLRCQWAPSPSLHSRDDCGARQGIRVARGDASPSYPDDISSACHGGSGGIYRGDDDRASNSGGAEKIARSRPRDPPSDSRVLQKLGPAGENHGTIRRDAEGGQKQPHYPRGASSNHCLVRERSLGLSAERSLEWFGEYSLERSRERSLEISRNHPQQWSRLPERPLGESKRGTAGFLRPSPSTFAERGFPPRPRGRSTSSTSALSTGSGEV